MGIQIYKSHQHSFNRINMKITWFFFLSLFLTLGACRGPQSSNTKKVDVLIIGGGASGSMAGIQSARMGSETLIAEKGPWLGGMLTSAGVSAIDVTINYTPVCGLSFARSFMIIMEVPILSVPDGSVMFFLNLQWEPTY
jgi:choline dehydrogenase-like flavoprotein